MAPCAGEGMTPRMLADRAVRMPQLAPPRRPSRMVGLMKMTFEGCRSLLVEAFLGGEMPRVELLTATKQRGPAHLRKPARATGALCEINSEDGNG